MRCFNSAACATEAKHFVQFNGKPVTSVKTAFKSAVRLVKLGPGISPHTLRHIAATWLMQGGADPWHVLVILKCRSKFC
jgi:integrase